jgi:hypothetical protein
MNISGSPNVIVKIAMNDNGIEAWVLHLEEKARRYRNELRTRLDLHKQEGKSFL